MEERLHKVIARAGIASRREAEKLIEAGRVTVNGTVIREHGHKVDPETDEIRVDTVPIRRTAAVGQDDRTYLLLNKPKGVVCTVKDPQRRTTVLDLCPPFQGRRLYPVGRLDEDSEGIVILTNDGELTARLTHPRYAVPKIYDVRVKGLVTGETARAFEGGVWLSDGRTGRSRVRLGKRGPRISHVEVTLTEGRNREIRRVFAKLGFPVLSLRRIQIGPVVPRGLKIGQYRPLDAEEVAALREVAEGRPTPIPRKRRAPSRQPGTGASPARAGGDRESAPRKPRVPPGAPGRAASTSRKPARGAGAGRGKPPVRGPGTSRGPATPRGPGAPRVPGTSRSPGAPRTPGGGKSPAQRGGGERPAARGGPGRAPGRGPSRGGPGKGPGKAPGRGPGRGKGRKS